MADKKTDDELLTETVEAALALEKSLVEFEAELMQIEQFRLFLAKQKEAQQQIADTWKTVEQSMIAHNVKSIKGDWGSITVGERLNWNTSDELPAKFYKKVPDTKKISDTFRLEGKAPKGAEPTYTKYLIKRIK